MKNEMEFGDWQEQVIRLMKKDRWTDKAIGTVDWNAWQDCYYDEGLNPEDAMLSEYEAANW